MKRSRHIPMTEKVACAVGMVLNVPYKHRKAMSASQLLSCIEWHHAVVPFAEGGPHSHWNLEPRWKPDHKLETRTVTQPAIAKGKRRMEASAELQRILLKPCGHKPVRSARWPKRKFQQEAL